MTSFQEFIPVREIIFFVSYLTLSGHKGKQILLTGASFTVGVFLAYLLVGLGFYKVLDLISEYMNNVLLAKGYLEREGGDSMGEI